MAPVGVGVLWYGIASGVGFTSTGSAFLGSVIQYRVRFNPLNRHPLQVNAIYSAKLDMHSRVALADIPSPGGALLSAGKVCTHALYCGFHICLVIKTSNFFK